MAVSLLLFVIIALVVVAAFTVVLSLRKAEPERLFVRIHNTNPRRRYRP